MCSNTLSRHIPQFKHFSPSVWYAAIFWHWRVVIGRVTWSFYINILVACTSIFADSVELSIECNFLVEEGECRWYKLCKNKFVAWTTRQPSNIVHMVEGESRQRFRIIGVASRGEQEVATESWVVAQLVGSKIYKTW